MRLVLIGAVTGVDIRHWASPALKGRNYADAETCTPRVASAAMVAVLASARADYANLTGTPTHRACLPTGPSTS